MSFFFIKKKKIVMMNERANKRDSSEQFLSQTRVRYGQERAIRRISV